MDFESASALKSKILSDVFDRFGPSADAQVAGTQPEAAPLIAVGIGATSTRGARTFRPAVRVQKRFLRDLPELREKHRAGQIDLRFIGDVVAQAPWNRRNVRPLEPGVSIAHHTLTAGTLGCFVTRNGQPGVLSCQHVLSQFLAGAGGATEHTIQAGKFDGGHPVTDRIGFCAFTVAIPNPAPHAVGGRNTLDCAVASVAALGANVIRGVGPITGIAPGLKPYLGDPNQFVLKLGRTTGLTKGVVTATEVDEIAVTYREGSRTKKLLFTGVFEIEELNGRSFSEGGDSGSLIVDRQGLVLGLLFAGSQRGGTNNRPRTFAIPIEPILAALQITIPPGPPPGPPAAARK